MKHFYRAAQGIEVRPLMLALQRNPQLWNQKRFRTTFDHTPHGEVDDILIRFSDDDIAKNKDTAAVMADGNCVWHPSYRDLPEIAPIVLAVMSLTKAWTIDRLVITRLKPGGRILPHADDQGDYVNDPSRSRFHVVLQGLPGSLYRTGDETATMLTGDLWWFDALTEHEVINNSADDRVHMLLDLRVWPT